MDKPAFFDAIGKLKLAELEEVSRRVGARIRVLRGERLKKALAKFREGDLVEFQCFEPRDPDHRKVRARIEKKGARTVTCVEVNHLDSAVPGSVWEVTPTNLKLVGVQ